MQNNAMITATTTAKPPAVPPTIALMWLLYSGKVKA
jgi:hypothetical protein